jgi:hypothetical protein
MSLESKEKVEAIFELREAAEKKAHAERDLAEAPSMDKRDVLLDAAIELEQKTQIALEACHECGEEHTADQPHSARGSSTAGGAGRQSAAQSDGNVVSVDFRGGSGQD